MRRDGPSHIARLGELHAALQSAAAIVPERGRRSSSTGSSSAGHRAPNCACCASARSRVRRVRPERAIRERERVVGGTELGKERDGALEVRDRAVVIARGGVEPAEAELGCRRGAPVADQRLEQIAGSRRALQLRTVVSARPTRAGR